MNIWSANLLPHKPGKSMREKSRSAWLAWVEAASRAGVKSRALSPLTMLLVTDTCVTVGSESAVLGIWGFKGLLRSTSFLPTTLGKKRLNLVLLSPELPRLILHPYVKWQPLAAFAPTILLVSLCPIGKYKFIDYAAKMKVTGGRQEVCNVSRVFLTL